MHPITLDVEGPMDLQPDRKATLCFSLSPCSPLRGTQARGLGGGKKSIQVNFLD
jgi:hypothetical protein